VRVQILIAVLLGYLHSYQLSHRRDVVGEKNTTSKRSTKVAYLPYPNKTRQTALGRGSRSDRPRYHPSYPLSEHKPMTSDTDFQSPASCGHDSYTQTKKSMSKVSRFKSWSGNKLADGRTRPIAVPCPLTRSVIK